MGKVQIPEISARSMAPKDFKAAISQFKELFENLPELDDEDLRVLKRRIRSFNLAAGQKMEEVGKGIVKHLPEDAKERAIVLSFIQVFVAEHLKSRSAVNRILAKGAISESDLSALLAAMLDEIKTIQKFNSGFKSRIPGADLFWNALAEIRSVGTVADLKKVLGGLEQPLGAAESPLKDKVFSLKDTIIGSLPRFEARAGRGEEAVSSVQSIVFALLWIVTYIIFHYVGWALYNFADQQWRMGNKGLLQFLVYILQFPQPLSIGGAAPEDYGPMELKLMIYAFVLAIGAHLIILKKLRKKK